jgi:hypothetical protein
MPGCGGAAQHVRHSVGLPGTIGYDRWHAVACKECGITIGASDRRFRNSDDAAAAWNRSAAPDTQEQVVPQGWKMVAGELKRVIREVPEPENDDVGKWVVGVARAVEAEVLAGDEALIRQLRDALDECLDDSNTVMGRYAQIYTERYRPHVLRGQEEVIAAANAALAAANARLGEVHGIQT